MTIATQPTSSALPCPLAPPPSPKELRAVQIAKAILEGKQQAKEVAASKPLDRYNPVILGGDLLTIAMIAFTIAELFFPSLTAIPELIHTATACGIAAGLINIGVGTIAGKQAAQCKANHKGSQGSAQGLRYAIDSAVVSILGSLMILTALAADPSIHGSSGAFHDLNSFFTESPFGKILLPFAFFLGTLPVIKECWGRSLNIQKGQDLASQLELDAIKTLLEEEKWEEAASRLMKKLEINEEEAASLATQINQAMEHLQEHLGVEAAIPIFELLLHAKTKEKRSALQALDGAKNEIYGIGGWNQIQRARAFQQLLYILAFVVSMVIIIGTLSHAPAFGAIEMTEGQEIALLLANLIPLCIDAFYPFKRNPHIVVPGLETQKWLELLKVESEESGERYSARGLQACLGYASWENFRQKIREILPPLESHLHGIPTSSDGSKPPKDYLLTREACAHIVEKLSPKSPEILAAQAYFSSPSSEP